MKTSLEGFKGKFEQTEERISKLEVKTMEIILSLSSRKKTLKNYEQTLRELWDTFKQTNFHIMGVPKGGEREMGREDI